MKGNSLNWVFGAILLIFSQTVPLSAQELPGHLTGYVYDAATGAPVFLATVAVEATSLGVAT